jgi:hypothetical protein
LGIFAERSGMGDVGSGTGIVYESVVQRVAEC